MVSIFYSLCLLVILHTLCKLGKLISFQDPMSHPIDEICFYSSKTENLWQAIKNMLAILMLYMHVQCGRSEHLQSTCTCTQPVHLNRINPNQRHKSGIYLKFVSPLTRKVFCCYDKCFLIFKKTWDRVIITLFVHVDIQTLL